MRAHAFLRAQSQIVAVPWKNFALEASAGLAAERAENGHRRPIGFTFMTQLKIVRMNLPRYQPH
jgi:hypothetical protein